MSENYITGEKLKNELSKLQGFGKRMIIKN